MAEQGIHEQVLVQGTAVDGDEGAVGPGAGLVDGRRDKLLAGARLADDEDVGHGGRGLEDVGAQVLHGGGGAHKAVFGDVVQLRHVLGWFAGPAGVLHELLVELFLLAAAQAVEQGVDGILELFELPGHGRQHQRVGAVAVDAHVHFIGQAAQALGGAACQPGQAQAQQADAGQQADAVDADDLDAGAGGGEAGVQHGQAAHDGTRAVGIGGKGDGREADAFHGAVLLPPGIAVVQEDLAGVPGLDVGDHGPVIDVVGAWPEGGAETGAAELALEAGAQRVAVEAAAGLVRLQILGLEEHPALVVEEDAADAGLVVGGAQGSGRRREHADGVAQDGQVQRKDEHALKDALAVVDGRGEADDVKGDALHGIVERDHGIDHFQGLADLHMAGPLGRAQAGEGVAHGGGGDIGRDGDDLAAVAEQQIALGGIRAHEGHLAVAQAFGTHAELEAAHHIFGVHGAGGQDEELVSGLCENLLKRKAHGLSLQLGIAGYCAIDQGFDTASRCEENK